MNARFFKYAPNVWLAQTKDEYKKGDIITLSTKYNKEVQGIVYNFIGKSKDGDNLYSFVRLENSTYAERKAQQYRDSEALHKEKSKEWYQKAQEGKDFLALGEPIKVGHHSEARHRALIDRNYKRICNSVKENDIAEEVGYKAEYWEQKSKEINLSMPESIPYFEAKLQDAMKLQDDLKSGRVVGKHPYSLIYATRDVKEFRKKLDLAKKLWA